MILTPRRRCWLGLCLGLVELSKAYKEIRIVSGITSSSLGVDYKVPLASPPSLGCYPVPFLYHLTHLIGADHHIFQHLSPSLLSVDGGGLKGLKQVGI